MLDNNLVEYNIRHLSNKYYLIPILGLLLVEMMTLKQTEMTFLWSQNSTFVCMTEINSNSNHQSGHGNVRPQSWLRGAEAGFHVTVNSLGTALRQSGKANERPTLPTSEEEHFSQGKQYLPELSGGNVADCLEKSRGLKQPV